MMRDLTTEEIESVSGGESWITVWVNPNSKEEGYETQQWQENDDGSLTLGVTWHSGAFPGQDQVIAELNNPNLFTQVFSWGNGDISVDFPGGVSANIATIRPRAMGRNAFLRAGSTPGHPNSDFWDSHYYDRSNVRFNIP